MKTLKKTPIAMFLMVVTALVMSACGSKNNNTTASLACTTTPGYGSSYGSSGYYGGNTGYYGSSYGNTGVLYQSGTSTQVSASQCSTVNGVATNGANTSGYGTSGYGYGSQVCNGVYYSPQYGRQGSCQQISAYSSTCAGLVVISPQTGQTITCM